MSYLWSSENPLVVAAMFIKLLLYLFVFEMQIIANICRDKVKVLGLTHALYLHCYLQ